MNVYDFDGTIFYPSSSVLFAWFCIKKHPKLLFSYFPKFLKAAKLYATGKMDRKRISGALHCVVRYLDDPDKDIAAFWKKYEKNISPWYLRQKRSDDLIISGSPEYLLKPITARLGVNLCATVVDKESGVMIGNVRVAKEKAKHIIEMDMPVIDCFYSDSFSDTPVALLAEHAFLVKDKAQTPVPWPHITNEFLAEARKKISMGPRRLI